MALQLDAGPHTTSAESSGKGYRARSILCGAAANIISINQYRRGFSDLEAALTYGDCATLDSALAEAQRNREGRAEALESATMNAGVFDIAPSDDESPISTAPLERFLIWLRQINRSRPLFYRVLPNRQVIPPDWKTL